MIWVDPKYSQMCPFLREAEGYLTHSEEKVVEAEEEFRAVWQEAKAGWQHPGAERGKGRLLLTASRGISPCSSLSQLPPGDTDFGFQASGVIHFYIYSFKLPNLWSIAAVALRS